MSSAEPTATAVLENPRLIPKSKIVVFDTQIYLGFSEPAVISSLRFYNEGNAGFSDPACTPPTFEVHSQQLAPFDYQAFGDILWVSLFNLSIERICQRIGGPCCRPATNINKDDSTFEIHPGQYLSATRNTNNVFPARCLFPNTKRWENYKPVPGRRKAVLIEGLLTRVERNEDRTIK
ncbi:hypothetical protein B0H13DRAFT_2300300 [Mycena leptocephala]|nr:hypothetical protein B0H13DRAFT_2300300 [Mycena leptocephala]